MALNIGTLVIMSMSQHIKSMAPSTGENDIVDDVSMADP
jgi:hypothetical protein